MPSYSDERLDRLEQALRRMEATERRVDAKLAQLDQRQRMQAAGLGFSAPSPGGGAYYADPGSTTLDALTGSASLEVWEILAAGDVSRGEKTVVNRHSQPTAEDARLFLSRCADGSFSVDNQDCPPPEE